MATLSRACGPPGPPAKGPYGTLPRMAAHPARRRALPPAEAQDLSLEAELQTELQLRRAERHAERVRERARRAAFRRFVLMSVVLLGLVLGLGYLVLGTFNALFVG